MILAGAACGGPGAEDPQAPRPFPLDVVELVQLAQLADWKDRLPPFPRFDVGEVVERWNTPAGHFVVHFTRQGRNRVLLADRAADGMPDLVQAVGVTLEAALSDYVDRLGFRSPVFALDAGGRTALDVFLVDFAGRGDGSFFEEGCRAGPPRVCQGLLLLENDFAGYRYGDPEEGARIVASHELFHAVQAAYDRPENPVLAEGTATWASETFDPDLTDFERAVPGYLASPDQPLGVAPVGPVPAFAYGSALFFQFLSERYGPGVVPALYQALERPANGPAQEAVNPTPWVPGLATLLEQAHTATFADAFAEFARWSATAGTSSAGPGFRNGAGYSRVAARMLPLPASEPLRLFSASAQHFVTAAPPDGALKVALAPALAQAPLDLAVFAQQGAGGERTLLGRATRELSLSLPPGTTGVHLVVSHGAPTGSAVRPTLCVGGDAEVAACRAAVPEPTTPPAAAMETGGCAVAPPGAGPLGGLGLALLALVALALRRRYGLRD